MRNDAAAREARRKRAQERLKASQPVREPVPPKLPTPDTPEAVLEFAASLGWTAERKKDGWLLKHPSGATAILHLTISDVAGWRNLRSVLLRPTRKASTWNLNSSAS